MKKSSVVLLVVVVIIANFLWLSYLKKNDNKTIHEKPFAEQIIPQLPIQDTSKNLDQVNPRRNAITNAVSVVDQSVVSVNVIKTQYVKRYTNPFQNPFFGFYDPYYKEDIQSIGTGVIINKDGYIITNSHVVEGATDIKVVMTDGSNTDAKLIGFDSIQDIAVLKIEEKNIVPAKLSDSSNILIGEWCIAIGNPYGFIIKDSKPSVSVGVISAVNRDFKEDQNGKIYKKMIQTDAAINPGNSGGPLVNVLGEVIGINSFILSESGGSNGIGFAIPINRVKKAVNEIVKYGRVRDIWFGFRVKDITPMIASYKKLKNQDGVIVTSVVKNGPAEKAGIRRGDVIKEINQVKINSTDDAEIAVSDVAVGDLINIVITNGKNDKMIKLKALEFK